MKARVAPEYAISEQQPSRPAMIDRHSRGVVRPYDDLLRDYSQMQEANRRRAVAMAAAAHELKTPLAIMNGYLELLMCNKLGPLSEKQAQVLTAMQASSSRLQQFIEDFLSYCAFDTGKLKVEFRLGNLRDCLKELYSIWLAR